MILELESERKEEERRGAEVVVNCRLARAVAAEGARRRRGRQRAIVTLCLCAAWVATTWAATTWARAAISWSLCICCYTTGRRTLPVLTLPVLPVAPYAHAPREP